MPTLAPRREQLPTYDDESVHDISAHQLDTQALPVLDIDGRRYDAQSAAILREWGFDSDVLTRAANRLFENNPEGFPTADEILESWGMAPLPDQDIDAMVKENHENHFRAVFAAEVERLRGAGLSRRKAREKAFRAALLDKDGGYAPRDEFGFVTEPDEERYVPGSLRDRAQQALNRLAKRVLKGTERISPRRRRLAATIGVAATAIALSTGLIAATDTVAGTGEQIIELPSQYFESINPEHDE